MNAFVVRTELHNMVSHNSTVQRLRRNVKRFRGGLVFKARRLLYHSTLGWRVIKKEKFGVAWERGRAGMVPSADPASRGVLPCSGFGFRVYRGTSLIRNSAPLGAHRQSQQLARARQSTRRQFLMGEVPL